MFNIFFHCRYMP